MTSAMTTAQRIQRLVELGFTQTRIAEACSISQPTVSNYLSGRHQSAREDVAARVRTGFDLLLADTPSREEAA